KLRRRSRPSARRLNEQNARPPNRQSGRSVNQPKAKLPRNQSQAYPTGRRLQMASDGNECAGIDPAKRGRVDRIGIPQRKKTGSQTAAMGPKPSSGRSVMMSGSPPKAAVIADIAWSAPPEVGSFRRRF